MNIIRNYIETSVVEGFSFGQEKYSTLLSFGLKVGFHSLPGFLLGHFLDEGVFWLQKKEILGQYAIIYILLQFSTWVTMFYLLFQLMPSYANEFQGNIAGIFFVTFFFLAQLHILKNLKSLLGTVDSYLTKLDVINFK